MQPWVVKCFFYVNMYPVLHQDEYKKELEVKAFKKNTGVGSFAQDNSWDLDSPYNDPKRFKNAVDHIFDKEFLDKLFGPNN